MKKFTTYSEIENLCEAMIKDFMKRKHYTNAHCVDIEAFVTEYLGIPIVYETFAEPDPGRIGFLSDGIRPLWVVRGNEKKQVLFPKNTVVLEKYLQTQTEIGRKRFTIAHEGAHFVESRGRLTAMGKTQWFESVISKVLRNSFYCGIMTYHKYY